MQPTVQVAAGITKSPYWLPERRSAPTTKKKPSFVNSVSLISFLGVHIPLRKRFQAITSLRDDFEGLELANSGQISVDKLLQAISGLSVEYKKGKPTAGTGL